MDNASKAYIMVYKTIIHELRAWKLISKFSFNKDDIKWKYVETKVSFAKTSK